MKEKDTIKYPFLDYLIKSNAISPLFVLKSFWITERWKIILWIKE